MIPSGHIGFLTLNLFENSSLHSQQSQSSGSHCSACPQLSSRVRSNVASPRVSRRRYRWGKTHQASFSSLDLPCGIDARKPGESTSGSQGWCTDRTRAGAFTLATLTYHGTSSTRRSRCIRHACIAAAGGTCRCKPAAGQSAAATHPSRTRSAVQPVLCLRSKFGAPVFMKHAPPHMIARPHWTFPRQAVQH